MISQIENIFPNLRGSDYEVTSLEDVGYNCLAWAAGDTTKWWWPDSAHEYFWPRRIPRSLTLDAFVSMFAEQGYERCNSGTHEENVLKVALFANESLKPTHAARQLENGRWTSKIGEDHDIEHDLKALEGKVYGRVYIYLKRPFKQQPKLDG